MAVSIAIVHILKPHCSSSISFTIYVHEVVGSVQIAERTWGGSGSATSPYLIEDAVDLNTLATDVNNGTTYSGVYFVLTNEIDISGYANWPGIGRGTSYFAGSFNGKGHTISGLQGTGSTYHYGLFGLVAGAEIIDVNVVLAAGATVTATYEVGGLIGRIGRTSINESTVVSGCTVDGNGGTIRVTGGGYAGGLVGVINTHAPTNEDARV